MVLWISKGYRKVRIINLYGCMNPAIYCFLLPFFADFQLNMKLKNLLENQIEILNILRGIGSRMSSGDQIDIKDLIPVPVSNDEELEELCNKITDEDDFRRQLVRVTYSLFRQKKGSGNSTDPNFYIPVNLGIFVGEK